MATMTVLVSETVTLNSTSQNCSYSAEIEGVENLFKRLVTVPAGNDVTVARFSSAVNINDAAMGIMMNTISLRGVLQSKEFGVTLEERAGDRKGQTYKLSVVKSSDTVVLPFELRDDITQEHLTPGESIVVGEDGGKYLQTTSRNALSIILQASLDDVRYGLLKEWGYGEEGKGGVPFALKQIFNKEYEDGTVEELAMNDVWKLWKLVKGSNSYFGF